MRTLSVREPMISDRDNVLVFDKGLGLDLRVEPQRRARNQLMAAERMSAIGNLACSISHDIRHSLSAIYANAEFLQRHNLGATDRADLVLDIQETILAMTERLDSLLQFNRSGPKKPFVREPVSLVVEKAITAVKFHPEGRNVSIRVGTFSTAEANIDAMSLQSAVYNLLLNACQAAMRSRDAPAVEVALVDVDQWLSITILDNGPGVPASVRETLFDPFVTVGKPNGTGIGLTLARLIAEEHGGAVRLEKSNSKGTVFTLSLMKNGLRDDPDGGRAA